MRNVAAGKVGDRRTRLKEDRDDEEGNDMKRMRRLLTMLTGILLDNAAVLLAAPTKKLHWVATWTCAPMLEVHTERYGFAGAPLSADTTIRNVIHVSMGGKHTSNMTLQATFIQTTKTVRQWPMQSA